MKVLEFARVKILPEFTKEQFIKEAKKVSRNFLAMQTGFISHRSYWTKQEEWVDLVEWESLADAESASAKVLTSEICQPWIRMMDPASIQMEHLQEIEL